MQFLLKYFREGCEAIHDIAEVAATKSPPLRYDRRIDAVKLYLVPSMELGCPILERRQCAKSDHRRGRRLFDSLARLRLFYVRLKKSAHRDRTPSQRVQWGIKIGSAALSIRRSSGGRAQREKSVASLPLETRATRPARRGADAIFCIRANRATE